MIGVLVNAATVIIGSLFGCLIKKGLSKRVSDAAMVAVGAAILCIAVPGIIKLNNALAVILSIVIGTIIGTLINIDGLLNRVGCAIENRFSKRNSENCIAQAFISSTLLFCVGAMTVVGSLNAGISGDNSMLFAKAILDLISSTMLAASLGIGVIFSVFSILIYQGGLVIAASLLAPILTEAAINDMTSVGSILILLLSLNLLKISKFKLPDFLPSLVISPLFTWLVSYLNI